MVMNFSIKSLHLLPSEIYYFRRCWNVIALKSFSNSVTLQSKTLQIDSTESYHDCRHVPAIRAARVSRLHASRNAAHDGDSPACLSATAVLLRKVSLFAPTSSSGGGASRLLAAHQANASMPLLGILARGILSSRGSRGRGRETRTRRKARTPIALRGSPRTLRVAESR